MHRATCKIQAVHVIAITRPVGGTSTSHSLLRAPIVKTKIYGKWKKMKEEVNYILNPKSIFNLII